MRIPSKSPIRCKCEEDCLTIGTQSAINVTFGKSYLENDTVYLEVNYPQWVVLDRAQMERGDEVCGKGGCTGNWTTYTDDMACLHNMRTISKLEELEFKRFYNDTCWVGLLNFNATCKLISKYLKNDNSTQFC